MGQRQNKDEIIYGNDCSSGWEAGKTPKHIYVRFSSIIQCPDLNAAQWKPPPNGRTFKLTQDPDFPCFWSYDIPPWYISWEVRDLHVHTILYLGDKETGGGYFGNTKYHLPEELHIYNNANTVCSGYTAGIEGVAIVTWRLESIHVLYLINMAIAYDLFLEMWPVQSSSLVFKYCRKRDGTNIKIELKP